MSESPLTIALPGTDFPANARHLFLLGLVHPARE
jgi:hypothetical protein